MRTIQPLNAIAIVLALYSFSAAAEPEAKIQVNAKEVLRDVSRTMAGACIEDVNHEIYGGIYSQMIFGESFQEPLPDAENVIKGFKAFGGRWSLNGTQLLAGALNGGAIDGIKLIADRPESLTGEVGVEVLFVDDAPGNAGLIVNVTDATIGADSFIGYEISLDPKTQSLRLGRHRQNFELIRDVSCNVPNNQWIPLSVTTRDGMLEIRVNGQQALVYQDKEHPLKPGRVGVRLWQREAMFRNLYTQKSKDKQPLPLVAIERPVGKDVSRMWRPFEHGTARGVFALEKKSPYAGVQSQRITLTEGQGEIGIENRGLNRWGMNYVADKPYEGYLWVKAEKPADLVVTLENADGSVAYAERKLTTAAGDWHRLDFQLTPNQSDTAGRFAIKLKQPGSVVLGHVFLQPGPWGRFKGLPVRKDVGDALVAQGLTVLRYGGTMINAPGYQWKKMIGPRDRRPIYKGFWYQYATNGWGILDFLDFCEAAGFLSIPALNSFEKPQDMADFVEYVNGPADSTWGKRRAADGHPKPYGLKYIQIGNEEVVDEAYWKRFEPVAKAMWAKDAQLILVVGDLIYSQKIVDPYKFTGSPVVSSLAAHKKILDLAKQHNREVWFDVHIGTEFPRDWQGLLGVPSFIEALGKISPGAKYQVVVFEYNSFNKHDLGRALGNARATNELMRLGVPIACSANCLQPYRQNDNGWDQGLLFLDPSRVWGQPPYYVTQMVSRCYLPKCVRAEVQSPGNALDVTATADASGKTVQLQVVNLEGKPLSSQIQIDGFSAANASARVLTLSGAIGDVNEPGVPPKIQPVESQWRHGLQNGKTSYTFLPNSYTIIRWE